MKKIVFGNKGRFVVKNNPASTTSEYHIMISPSTFLILKNKTIFGDLDCFVY